VRAPNLIAAAVIGMSLVLAAAVFALVGELLRSIEDDPSATVIARLERQIAQQSSEILTLREKLKALPAAQEVPRTGAPQANDLPQASATDQFGGIEPPDETEGLNDPMQLATSRFNKGIEPPRPAVLRELLGEPRDSYTQNCQPVTNRKLMDAFDTRRIGEFQLTMLKPALDSLEHVIERVRVDEPDIYAAIGTAGALCARYVRGSARSVSSHAWGVAVDLKLKRNLDRMGDGSTQFGLVVLAEFFNDAGWYWGASYGREDSMHFEVGETLLRKWIAEGKL
jgi:D-alanyl-D-alanine carboxypeptidase